MTFGSYFGYDAVSALEGEITEVQFIVYRSILAIGHLQFPVWTFILGLQFPKHVFNLHSRDWFLLEFWCLLVVLLRTEWEIDLAPFCFAAFLLVWSFCRLVLENYSVGSFVVALSAAFESYSMMLFGRFLFGYYYFHDFSKWFQVGFWILLRLKHHPTKS